jgi:ATP-dependent Zn protease
VLQAAETHLNTVIQQRSTLRQTLEHTQTILHRQCNEIKQAIQEFNQSTNTYIEECQKLIASTDKRYTVEAYEELLTKVNSLKEQLKQPNDALVKKGVDNSKQIERMHKHYSMKV